MEGGVLDEIEATADVLLSDTMDQYRTFQMCERLLHTPTKLANQLLFQIPPHRQIMLIERWCSQVVIWFLKSRSNKDETWCDLFLYYLSTSLVFFLFAVFIQSLYIHYLYGMCCKVFIFMINLLCSRLDIMPLMMHLCEKCWERNSPKEQRKTWMISVPRQVWRSKAADDK